MSQTLNSDLRLERCLRRNGVQPIISRESIVISVERPLTASQARNQQLLSQEPADKVVEESVLERVECTLDSHNEQPDHLHVTS